MLSESWTSAKHPAMKYCLRIFAREHCMPDSYRAVWVKSKRRIILQILLTFWKLQGRTTHSALPSWLNSLNAHKKTRYRVERHKISCLKETLCPAVKNRNNVFFFFFFNFFFLFYYCKGVVHKEFVLQGQTKQRCTARHTWEHST